MAKGLALTIGLNAVDPRYYAGWNGRLSACEADARDMADLARARTFTVKRLLTRSATRRAVLAGIARAAAALRSGDIFLLTYSGHGGQVPDRNHDEPDLQDETWCLYDGQLIDDELYFELSKFATGVRILVLSDSCHSGSVTRARPPQPPPGQRSKAMPDGVAIRVYEAHKTFYDQLQAGVQVRQTQRGHHQRAHQQQLDHGEAQPEPDAYLHVLEHF